MKGEVLLNVYAYLYSCRLGGKKEVKKGGRKKGANGREDGTGRKEGRMKEE